MKFQRRKKPIVEALTFDELVEHGKKVPGANIVNGMPWSFDYNGCAFTHENDNLYLFVSDGQIMRMRRGDMLVTEGDDVRPVPFDHFVATYEAVACVVCRRTERCRCAGPLCPDCKEPATYRTPDGTYWCSMAHGWRAK